MVVERLGKANGIRCSKTGTGPGRSRLWSNIFKSGSLSLFGAGAIGHSEVVLAKPLTFMNRSGLAVSELLSTLDIPPAQSVVVCDDCELPFGRIRIRRRGGGGGHRGLESIIERLGSTEFPRVRVGVGRPTDDEVLTDYLLGPFSPEESARLDEVLETSVAAIEDILGSSIEHAMNRFN
jgi:PTH1 family peptidyl-tRNA hydrolase